MIEVGGVRSRESCAEAFQPTHPKLELQVKGHGPTGRDQIIADAHILATAAFLGQQGIRRSAGAKGVDV